MAISFISDLHLDKSRPHINKYFIEYLNHLDNSVTDLYILGDLFEYWVGDDDPMDGLEEVRDAITNLGKKLIFGTCMETEIFWFQKVYVKT